MPHMCRVMRTCLFRNLTLEQQHTLYAGLYTFNNSLLILFYHQITAIITEFKKFLLNFGSGELISLVDLLGVRSILRLDCKPPPR